MRFVLLASALLAAVRCSPPSGSGQLPPAKPTAAPTEAGLPLHTCALSNDKLAFAIDRCNCGDLYAAADTVAIKLSPAEGGEIQGRLLRITNPLCDSSYVVLMQHQNRYYVSSMGPDPVLTDWLLYTSPIDTIRFDRRRQGFFIDTIAAAEQARFPKFDTLAFYRAYRRAVRQNLRSGAVPAHAKGALYREYKTSRAHARELLAESGVELHRVILKLKKGRAVEKVLLFDYSHFG